MEHGVGGVVGEQLRHEGDLNDRPVTEDNN